MRVAKFSGDLFNARREPATVIGASLDNQPRVENQVRAKFVHCILLGRRQAVRHPALAGHPDEEMNLEKFCHIGASPSGKAPRLGGAFRLRITMFYVYVLQSEKDSKLYIGQTNNLEDRISRHNKGEVVSTKNRRPFKLLISKSFSTRTEAVSTEKYLKSLKGGNEFRKILSHWGVAKR